MSKTSELISKSALLSKVAIKTGNELHINGNECNIANVHFRNNKVALKGKENRLDCAESSYFRDSSILINGNACSVTVKAGTAVYGNNSQCVYMGGNNNEIEIGTDSSITNSSFFINGSFNRVIVGNKCRMMETKIHIEGNHNLVIIGDECSFHGRTPYPTTLFCDEGTSITVGNDCMFAHGIRIRPTDSHCIVDLKGNRLNTPENIEIGEHCWIGLDAVLLKGTHIPAHSVVAARAVCTKKYTEEHCIIAGNPGRIVKHDIDWVRDLPKISEE